MAGFEGDGAEVAHGSAFVGYSLEPATEPLNWKHALSLSESFAN